MDGRAAGHFDVIGCVDVDPVGRFCLIGDYQFSGEVGVFSVNIQYSAGAVTFSGKVEENDLSEVGRVFFNVSHGIEGLFVGEVTSASHDALFKEVGTVGRFLKLGAVV